MSYQHVKVPAGGQKITVNKDYSLNVPDRPIIPYIEGDGTGYDITPVMIKVVDAAVAKAYKGKREIKWMEIYAGEKATKVYGPDVWLPDETLKILREYVVSIKGPLTTPVGGGIRSLNSRCRCLATATAIKNRLPDLFSLLWWAAGGKAERHDGFPYRDTPQDRETFTRAYMVREQNLTRDVFIAQAGGMRIVQCFSQHANGALAPKWANALA